MATIRRATVEDARAIAEVHLRTWQVAYRDILDPAALDALSIDDWAKRREDILRRADPSIGTWVAEEKETIVGFSAAGPSRDADAEGGELYAIYVSPDRWGTGIGRSLLEVAESFLRTHGYTAAILWVLTKNASSRRFYEQASWRHQGSMKADEFFGIRLEETRYRRDL